VRLAVIEGINTGDLESLMTLYEPLACFASQPGQLAHNGSTLHGMTAQEFDEDAKKNEEKYKKFIRRT
jgi:hypothetical protein